MPEQKHLEEYKKLFGKTELEIVIIGDSVKVEVKGQDTDYMLWKAYQGDVVASKAIFKFKDGVKVDDSITPVPHILCIIISDCYHEMKELGLNSNRFYWNFKD